MIVPTRNRNRAIKILKLLRNKYCYSPRTSTPFEVLIATVLSQRTRDSKTSSITKNLFSRFKTPEELVNAQVSEIEKVIKQSGFYRVKARRIKEIARIIIEKYKGKVPSNIEELIKLPGVGRKTANCVQVYGFNIPAIPVDTHVHRVSNRMGLVNTKTPENTEFALKKLIPQKFWLELNSIFVEFGKEVCKPQKPLCSLCIVENLCDKNF